MTSAVERSETEEGYSLRVLGLVTDPDMPTQVGTRLARSVTYWLNERTGNGWTVQVVCDPVTAAETNTRRIIKAVENYRSQRNWDYAVCLTDLPVLLQDRPLLADASRKHRVALVSLPAFGGIHLYRRVREMLTFLLEELLACHGSELQRHYDRTRAGWISNMLAPVRRSPPPGEDIELRYTATRFRGWLRLVSGMVRTNRPWQLIFGLSGALAAALAASAFGLSSSTIWQIGDRLDAARQIVAVFASIGLLVGWLISAHGLWERRRHREAASWQLTVLYNTSTVLTLTIRVACLYAGLFVVNVGAALFLVTPGLLSTTVGHPATWSMYLRLAWGFTTMGVVAGALGSSLESDQAVRQAAYGYREEQRRAEHAASDSE